MYLDNERRPTLTPQLAFRVAVIGGVALVMFAIIFFRLWYLQILSGDKYLADANMISAKPPMTATRQASWGVIGGRFSVSRYIRSRDP